MGFNVENDLFAKHSWYFRNALVRANYQNIQKGIKRESDYLERFFRNLLMGENNELKNRYMVVGAPLEWVKVQKPTSTRQVPDKLATNSTEIQTLIEVLAEQQLSIKEILAAMNLKDRENFMVNYLNPAIKKGFVSMLYPGKPHHPRQKYLLTVKGLSVYNSNNATR